MIVHVEGEVLMFFMLKVDDLSKSIVSLGSVGRPGLVFRGLSFVGMVVSWCCVESCVYVC